MATLRDYIKGFGKVPIYRVIGDKEWFVLVMPDSSEYFFMHNDEVVETFWAREDRTEKIVIKIRNKTATEEDMLDLEQQTLFLHFRSWYYKHTKKDWKFKS